MSKDRTQIIQTLKSELTSGNMKQLNTYYTDYQQDFYQFARKYTSNEELIQDTYQDMFVIFYENVLSGKLKELSSTLKTYLFSIGKYNLFNRIKKSAKEEVLGEYDQIEESHLLLEQEEELQARKAELEKALEQVGKKCQQILKLFYYQKASIKEIMQQLDYKNENTVKAHKSRCMKTLKSYFNII